MLTLALFVLFTLSSTLACSQGQAQMPTASAPMATPTAAPMAAPSGMVGAPGMQCTQQWECNLPNITDDYNFVQCVDSICICRLDQGFIGLGNISLNSSNPILDNSMLDINGPCSCPSSFTLVWENGIPFCRDNRIALACSAQWECDDVTENFHFVECNTSGICSCRHEQGFLGSGTIDDPCHCPANNSLIWEDGLLFCLNATMPLECTQQWQCQEVSTDFNFVECTDAGLCRCRLEAGFLGNATHDDLCRCNLTVFWVNSTALCLDLETESRLESTQDPALAMECQEHFQCSNSSTLFQAVDCLDDRCICANERGFTGLGTVDSQCRCEEPRIIFWQDGLPFCVDITSLSS